MVENPVDSKYSVSQNESVAEPETETETLIQDDLLKSEITRANTIFSKPNYTLVPIFPPKIIFTNHISYM